MSTLHLTGASIHPGDVFAASGYNAAQVVGLFGEMSKVDGGNLKSENLKLS